MHGITKNKIIKSGDKITAECILTGGNPLGKIIWYKGIKHKSTRVPHLCLHPAKVSCRQFFFLI